MTYHKKYLAEYHQANREARNARSLARYHALPLAVKLAPRKNSKRRSLVAKVTECWGVTAQEARRFIEQGKFPE